MVETYTAGGGLEAHNRLWNATPDGLTLGSHSASSLMLNDVFDASGTIVLIGTGPGTVAGKRKGRTKRGGPSFST